MLYHGTNTESGKQIIDSQIMLPSTGSRHWLGDGIYFFRDSKHAYRWILIEAEKKDLSNRLLKHFMIVEAEVNLEEDRLLDLDELENWEELNNVKKMMKKTREKYNSFSDDKFADGFLINFMFEKLNYRDDYDAVKFTYGINSDTNEFFRCKMPQYQICIKNGDVIGEIRDHELTKERIKTYESFYNKYFLSKSGHDKFKNNKKLSYKPFENLGKIL